MGFFKKKNEAPVNQTNEAEVQHGPFEEISCMITVSQDGKTHPMEAEGAVRFYADEMAVYGPKGNPGSAKNLAKNLLFGSAFSDKSLSELIRFPYVEVARAWFPKKRVLKVELKDGRYAFFIHNSGNRDAVAGKIAGHGVAVDPFEK